MAEPQPRPRRQLPRFVAAAVASIVGTAPAAARADPPAAGPLPDELPPLEQPPAPEKPPEPPPAPEKKPREPDKPHEPSVMNMIRGDLACAYVRGSKMVGYGTRQPYEGGACALRLDVLRFPGQWIGFGISLVGTLSSTDAASPPVALEGSLAFAPLRWKGPWGGSFVLGGGNGFSAGPDDGTWIKARVRAYPFVFSRLRLMPTQRVSLHAAYHLIPIETAPLTVRVHQGEVGIGVANVLFGARLDLGEATGGDPVRTYRESSYGVFFGGVYY